MPFDDHQIGANSGLRCIAKEGSPIMDVPLLDAGSFRMIESLEVENFRSFRFLRLSNLKRINLLVGRSASGKTALLEAVRLALGANPQVAWTLNTTRGVPLNLQPNPTREQFEGLWQSYFFDFDTEKKISFKIMDSINRWASASIYFDSSRPVTPVPQVPNPGMPAYTNTIIPLAFDRNNFIGEKSILDATVNAQQWGSLNLQQGSELGQISEFFPSTWQSNASQVANWLSQLRIGKSDKSVIDAVTKQFPDIIDLSVENPLGAPAIYANLKFRSQLVPIGLISSGINKFISMLVAIQTYRNGVVIIDEIENGIYFKMFPALWRTLWESAIQNNTQLFLSSHSLECIRSANDIINKSPENFSVIQVYQDKGESSAMAVAGEKAAAAIEADLELRVG